MITRFSLRNFKAFGTRRELAFRPLTVLTGLNSAGKSSVIQSILLAKQAASRTARVVQLNGPYGLALGESQDVLNSESTDQQIEFTFTYLSAQSSERTVELSLGTDPPDALNLSVIRNGGVPPQLEQDDRRFTYLCAERLGPREMLELSAEQPDLVGVGWQGQYVAQVLAISGSVATDVTAPALAAAWQVLRVLAESGLTDDERDVAVQNLVGVAPLKYETAAAVAATLADQVEQYLPDDYQANMYARLAGTGTVEATPAVVSAFAPERLVVVLVGDASQIEEPVAKLGLGPVTVVRG